MAEKSEQLKATELKLAASLTNIKQRKFAMFYVENGGNGTAAAEAAGYANPAQSACQNLKLPKVVEAIETYSRLCTRNAGESRETIIAREVNWASGDIRDFFVLKAVLDNEGNPSIHPLTGEAEITEEMIPITEWTKEQAQRVKKISWNRNGPVLELHDPMRANRNLAEYNGLTVKESDALSADDAANLIGAAMARMDELDHTPAASD